MKFETVIYTEEARVSAFGRLGRIHLYPVQAHFSFSFIYFKVPYIQLWLTKEMNI